MRHPGVRCSRLPTANRLISRFQSKGDTPLTTPTQVRRLSTYDHTEVVPAADVNRVEEDLRYGFAARAFAYLLAAFGVFVDVYVFEGNAEIV